MKVLFAIHGFPPQQLGGSEIYAFSLAKALKRRGLDVVVFARSFDPDVYSYSVREDEVEGVRVIRVINNRTDINYFSDHIIDTKMRESFVAALLREKPDIVHFHHLLFLSGDLPYIARSHGIPNIMTLHDYWYFCVRVNLFKPDHTRCYGPEDGLSCAACVPRAGLIEKLYGTEKIRLFFKKAVPKKLKDAIKSVILKGRASPLEDSSRASADRTQEFSSRIAFFKKQLLNCDRIISPSRHLQKRYLEQGFGDVGFLPLGMEPMPIVRKKKLGEMIRLGFVGNINPTKGLAVLLKELRMIKDQGNIEVHIFGQALDEKYFKKEFSFLADHHFKNIKFHGRFERDAESLRNVYENIDILVLPSLCEENSPLAVRESLMTGTPVVASNLGGVSEIVADLYNGLLFDPYVKGDLARKVEKLIKDRGLLAALSKGASETKVLLIDEHVEQIMDLYTGLTEHFA